MTKKLLNRDLPLVAIVGRPNVGKSTLFNRITGSRKAAVHNTPGLTRDRNYLPAEWDGHNFMLIDTGGYETETTDEIYRQMREQTLLAIDEANVIIFLGNLFEPDHPVDDDVLKLLRKSGKPSLLAVNKCDGRERRLEAVAEFAHHGTDQVVGISALHGTGINELLDEVVKLLPGERGIVDPASAGIRIAVAGRPNVGKSTLVNKILGFERVIANAMPGTTRDSVDTTFERNGKTYTIIDTAGIRRRGKVEKGPEKLSVVSSMFSLEKCDIALILIDGAEGPTEQDAHVAGYAVDSGCASIIVVNKWDTVEKDHKTAEEFTKDLREAWGFLKDSPVIFISALTGQRVEKLFEFIDRVYAEYTKEIETSTLNEWLKQTTSHVSPPIRSGKQLKIKYATQTGTKPPTFTLFVNDPDLVHFSYERYLINQLRQEFGMEGVPVKLRFRQKAETNPFANAGHGPRGRKKS
jgi:GTPase